MWSGREKGRIVRERLMLVAGWALWLWSKEVRKTAVSTGYLSKEHLLWRHTVLYVFTWRLEILEDKHTLKQNTGKWAFSNTKNQKGEVESINQGVQVSLSSSKRGWGYLCRSGLPAGDPRSPSTTARCGGESWACGLPQCNWCWALPLGCLAASSGVLGLWNTAYGHPWVRPQPV